MTLTDMVPPQLLLVTLRLLIPRWIGSLTMDTGTWPRLSGKAPVDPPLSCW